MGDQNRAQAVAQGVDDALAEHVFDGRVVNLAGLDAALRAALGPAVAGVSVAGDRVRVHVRRGTSRASVAAVVDAHDPAALTDDQRQAADRQAAAARLRQPWSRWSAADKDALLQLLAAERGLLIAADDGDRTSNPAQSG